MCIEVTSALDRIPIFFTDSYLTVLLILINSSIEHGVFPQALKTAVVKPNIKNYNLDCQDVANYCPITNMSSISKLLEKTVVQQPRDHLEDNNVLFKFQSACRKFLSAGTALLKITIDILLNLEMRKSTLYIGLDLSAAFDTINHDKLLCVPENGLGIEHRFLSFIRSYFSGRSQKVLIDDIFSAM